MARISRYVVLFFTIQVLTSVLADENCPKDEKHVRKGESIVQKARQTNSDNGLQGIDSETPSIYLYINYDAKKKPSEKHEENTALHNTPGFVTGTKQPLSTVVNGGKTQGLEAYSPSNEGILEQRVEGNGPSYTELPENMDRIPSATKQSLPMINKQGTDEESELQPQPKPAAAKIRPEILQKGNPFQASKHSVKRNPKRERVLNKFESNFHKTSPTSGKAFLNNGEVEEELKKSKAEHAIINKVKEQYRKILEKIVDTEPLASRIESKLTQRQSQNRQGEAESLSKVKNKFSLETTLSDRLDGDIDYNIRGYGEWKVHLGTYSENMGHEGLGTVQNERRKGERRVVEKDDGHGGKIKDTKNEGSVGHRWILEDRKEMKDETRKWKSIDNGRIASNYEGERRIAGIYEGIMEGIIEGQSAGKLRIARVNKGKIALVGKTKERMKKQDEKSAERENVGQRRILVGLQEIKEGIQRIRKDESRIHEGRKLGTGTTERVKQVEQRIKEQGIEWEKMRNQEHRIQRVKEDKEGLQEVMKESEQNTEKTNEGERKILLGQNGIGSGKLEENEGLAGVLKNIDKLLEKVSGDGIGKAKEGERRVLGVHGEIQGEIRERVGSRGREREEKGEIRIAANIGQLKERLREQEKMRVEGIRGGTRQDKAVPEGVNEKMKAERRKADKRIERVREGQRMIMMKQEEGEERMRTKMEEYRKRVEKEMKGEQIGMESGIKERKTGWDRLLGEEERKDEY